MMIAQPGTTSGKSQRARTVLYVAVRDCGGGSSKVRRRLNGYLASWVPSPPGRFVFQNCTVSPVPETAGEKKTRYLLG